MADNIGYTPGTGATVAADDVGGALHQRVKLSLGADGSATDAPGDGTHGLVVDVSRQLHGLATAVTDAWSSADAEDDTTPTCAVSGYASLTAIVTTDGGTCSAGAITFEASADGGTTWVPIAGIVDQFDLGAVYPLTVMTLTGFAGTPYAFRMQFDVAGCTHFRARLSTAITGTLDVTLRFVASTARAPEIALAAKFNSGTELLGDVVIRRDTRTISVASGGLTTATTAYSAGDQVGSQFTLANAARAADGTGRIKAVTLVDAADIIGPYDVLITDASITPASDNAAFSISDSDALHIVALIPLTGAYDLGANRLCQAVNLDIPYLCSGGTSLYANLITRAGHTFFGATTNLQLNVWVERD